jgi:hypothetical protein
MSGKEDLVRLILDQYYPQLSIPAIIVTKQNYISVIILPPHTSHCFPIHNIAAPHITLPPHISHCRPTHHIAAPHITLPPHTSHKLRPLDCTIFCTFGTYDNIALMTGYCQTQANLQHLQCCSHYYWSVLKKNKVCGNSFKSVMKGSEVKWREVQRREG